MGGTVFITGGSSGIGKALAEEYARLGWNVGVLARRVEALDELVGTLRGSYPSQRFAAAAADVTDDQEQFKALDRLLAELGLPTVFIANSGMGKRKDPLQPVWPHVKRTLMTNLLGAIAGMEYIKDAWVREGRPGHLVAISSVAGARGLRGTAPYSASKAALATYMESIGIELPANNIHVTCIFPGFVKTPMTASNPWMPWLLEPDEAARHITRAIEKRKARYVFPFPMRLIFSLLRHLPGPLYDWAARRVPSYKEQE